MTGSRRRGWLALVLALVATAALLPLPWLVVLEGQRPRLALPGTTGTTFVLRWTHSVEREDWESASGLNPTAA